MEDSEGEENRLARRQKAVNSETGKEVGRTGRASHRGREGQKEGRAIATSYPNGSRAEEKSKERRSNRY